MGAPDPQGVLRSIEHHAETSRRSSSGIGRSLLSLDRHEVDRKVLLGQLRDARFSDGIFCPRCGHREVQRWGTFSGRQRYRCKHCGRTFSDLTGTPAAYLKKIELLPAYCDALATQLSIRKAALRVGIHPSTAFRWRHRLLDGLRQQDAEKVSGWVELGAFWLAESHKGLRNLERRIGRPPRRRGGRHGWNLFYDGPRVYVAVACDRTGRVVSAPAPVRTREALGLGNLQAALEGRIERAGSLDSLDSLNLTATREARPAGRTFAARIGATYHDAFLPPGRLPEWMRGTRRRIKAPPGDRSLVHVRTVVPYIRRFRAWLRRFRGVATKYLPNYLLWHRLVDANTRNCFRSQLLRWSDPSVERS